MTPARRRLVIPRALEVRGQAWRVRSARRIPGDGRGGKASLGLCDYDARTIWLLRSMRGDKRGETFVHELLHALTGEWADEAELARMEAVIDKLEAPLHALLLSGQIAAVLDEEVP